MRHFLKPCEFFQPRVKRALVLKKLHEIGPVYKENFFEIRTTMIEMLDPNIFEIWTSGPLFQWAFCNMDKNPNRWMRIN